MTSTPAGCATAPAVVSANFTADGGATVVIADSIQAACQYGQPGPGNATGTALVLHLGSAVGTATVQPDGGGAAGARLYGWLTDGHGNGGGGQVPASGGTITVDAFDGGSISGTFDLDFSSGPPSCSVATRVQGRFESSACALCP